MNRSRGLTTSGDSLASNLAGFRELHSGDVPQDAQAHRADLADDFVASQSDALAQLPRAALSQPPTRFMPMGSFDSDDDSTTASYSLTPLGVANQTARFEVWLELVAAGGEKMVYFSLDVLASDPVLVQLDGGTGEVDYSAFSFTKASPLLDAWNPLSTTGFGPGELNAAVELETASWPLGWGSYRLGVLQVDLADTALEPGDQVHVSLGGPESVIGVEQTGNPSTFHFWMHSSPAPPMSIRSSAPARTKRPASEKRGVAPFPSRSAKASEKRGVAPFPSEIG